MDILLNKAHYPVHVLGPGRRIGLWLQGCSIACPGCISQDTWEADPGRRMPLQQLLAWCAERIAACDGVTISGGEPFEQPQALAACAAATATCWRALTRSFPARIAPPQAPAAVGAAPPTSC